MKLIDPFGLAILHLELAILWRIDCVVRERLIAVELARVETHAGQQRATRLRHVCTQNILLNIFPGCLRFGDVEWLNVAQLVALVDVRRIVSKLAALYVYYWSGIRWFGRN